MRFEFATSQRIVFGPGTVAQAGDIVASFGTHVLVVMGSRVERAQPLIDQLTARRLTITRFQVTGEPTIALAQRGRALAHEARCDVVVSLGGGSVIDTGKAVAALATNTGDVLDYLEIIGKARPLKQAPLPFVAIPTTSGSGAEATRNAVLASPEHKVKVSLRSPLMLPTIALVDPELTHDLPPGVTAATGMDALAQVLEPFVSTKASPLTDALCREGMARAAQALRRAFEHGDDAAARADMSLASLLGGMALANAGLGAVHGFAAPIGGMFPAPHGAVCARLLPIVFETNVRALRERAGDNPVLARFDEVARILTLDTRAQAEAGAAWLRELCGALGIAPLGSYGVAQADVPGLVEKAALASSMQANPIKLTRDELSAILSAAI